MKFNIIYALIFLIIIVLVILVFNGRNNYEEKISFLKEERSEYIDRIDGLLFTVKERDKMIMIVKGDLSDKIKEVKALKLKEDEVQSINIIDIPVDERNRTIERIASEE